MRFEPESKHGANNGLNIARDHMEKIKAKFPWISYGDLWTLAGIASVAELGGPVVRFSASRVTSARFSADPYTLSRSIRSPGDPGESYVRLRNAILHERLD